MPVFTDPSSTAHAGGAQVMTGKSDAELLNLYSDSRSEAAFRELVRRHSGVVLAAARRRLSRDQAMTEDAVQQTFILLARHPTRAARAVSLAAWLHRAAVYEASNLLRREMRHRRRMMTAAGEGEAVSPEESDPWLSALPHLDEALASLNETDRSLLILHYMEGLSYAEVGERLHCSQSNAQRRGHRALEKLAARLRRRNVTVPLAVLASGMAQAVLPVPAHAAVAGRALAAGGTTGTGAGFLTALLSPLAVGTAVALVASTAVFWAVRSPDPTPVTPRVTLAKAVVPDKITALRPSAPPVARQPAFQPEKEDDKLTVDEMEFIKLAKSDPAAAMAWARTKFPAQSPLRNFLQTTVRALADRELAAADRLLANAGAKEPAARRFFADSYLRSVKVDQPDQLAEITARMEAELSNAGTQGFREDVALNQMREDPAAYVAELTPEEVKQLPDKFLGETFRAWADKDSPAAVRWALSLNREQDVVSGVRSWYSLDPSAAAGFAFSLPAGKMRDGSLSELCDSFGYGRDFEAAERCLAAIEDQTIADSAAWRLENSRQRFSGKE